MESNFNWIEFANGFVALTNGEQKQEEFHVGCFSVENDFFGFAKSVLQQTEFNCEYCTNRAHIYMEKIHQRIQRVACAGWV